MPLYRALRNFVVTRHTDGTPDVTVEAGQVVNITPDIVRAFQGALRSGWLIAEAAVPIGAVSAFPNMDTSRKDTDWDNIYDLFEDMKKYARDNPDCTFLCADDQAGQRFGWVAYESQVDDSEKIHQWTIPLTTLKTTYRRNLHPDGSIANRTLETIKDRQEHLRRLVAEAREAVPVAPKTLWERLDDD